VLVRRELQALAAVAGDDDLEAVLFKVEPQQLGYVLVVFYYKCFFVHIIFPPIPGDSILHSRRAALG
jgi:hypothetical protein